MERRRRRRVVKAMDTPSPMKAPHFPIDLLVRIYNRIPCPIGRRHMSQVCGRDFRNTVAPQRPLPRLLPWILLPRAGGPSFSCVVRGCGTHRFRVPVDARGARYFGSFDGGWLFLALDEIHGHTLLNIRTNQRIRLPDVLLLYPERFQYDMVIRAATLSSPPDDEHCVAAAISSAQPFSNGPRVMVFWNVGHPLTATNHRGQTVPVATCHFSEAVEIEDVIYHRGAFYYLTFDEDLIGFTVEIHDGSDLEVLPMGKRCFLPQEPHGGILEFIAERSGILARYIVESRGNLLMVWRFAPNHPPQPMSAVRVFEMAVTQVDNGDGDTYRWNELHTLDGRILFVGRGCSRSYEVAEYPGFEDSVYFLDDKNYYAEGMYGEEAQYGMAGTRGEYPCIDSGKCSIPGQQVDNFLPDQDPSSYSHPGWLLP